MRFSLSEVSDEPPEVFLSPSSMVAMVNGCDANGAPPSVGKERNALCPARQCSARRRGTAMRRKCGESRVIVAFAFSSAFTSVPVVVEERDDKAAKSAEGGLYRTSCMRRSARSMPQTTNAGQAP